ncbi:MAG: hypothetical protein Q4F81_08825 [Eubacteriales bacterium]|nr:hypothetical protein [Eubacteriales bacterium]
MRKRLTAAIAAMTVFLLCACAQQETTNPIATATPTVQTATPAETAALVEDVARKVFQAALKTIHDDLVWPDLDAETGKIEIFEPNTIEDEQFAVMDVDADGEEELLVSVSNTYMAGMRLAVYGYDAASGGLRLETDGFPAVTFYPGMMKMLSSHNQGHAGDVLWPYGILTYDPETDTYRSSCFVDAWDRNLSETDFEGNPYPEDIDTDNVGHVYLISDETDTQTLNQADFEKWESEMFAGKEEITVPWQKLTVENISST